MLSQGIPHLSRQGGFKKGDWQGGDGDAVKIIARKLPQSFRGFAASLYILIWLSIYTDTAVGFAGDVFLLFNCQAGIKLEFSKVPKALSPHCSSVLNELSSERVSQLE